MRSFSRLHDVSLRYIRSHRLSYDRPPKWVSPHKVRQHERFSSTHNTKTHPSTRRWTFVAMAGIVSVLGAGGSALFLTTQEHVAPPPLNRQNFLPFFIACRDRVSSTSEIITLKPTLLAATRDPYEENSKKGLWCVLALQPQLQIARSYTPLPPTPISNSTEPDVIRLLIRHHPSGEVSNYLHNLYVGNTIHLRGPYPEYEIPDGVDKVLFLAGGTGIAPALQTIHTLFDFRGGGGRAIPKMKILWANKKWEDCEGGVSDWKGNGVDRVIAGLKKLLYIGDWRRASAANTAPIPNLIVQELGRLKEKYPGQITVDYFVDEEDTTITESVLRRCLKSLSVQKAGAGMTLVLVSGPDGFVGHYAGPKHWENGTEQQGPLGGVLQGIDATGWKVWKL